MIAPVRQAGILKDLRRVPRLSNGTGSSQLKKIILGKCDKCPTRRLLPADRQGLYKSTSPSILKRYSLCRRINSTSLDSSYKSDPMIGLYAILTFS